MARLWTIILAIGLLNAETPSSAADERLWLDAKVNGKRAILCFDSGADDLILSREGASRLGLRFTEPPTNGVLPAGDIPAGVTEACLLSLQGTEAKARFRIFDLPKYINVGFDGLVGWRPIRGNVIQVNAAAGKLTFLEKVPAKAAKWTRLAIVTNSNILQLRIPCREADDCTVSVDTGSYMGVSLPPGRWQAWKMTHQHQPTTLNSFFTPADGLAVCEEAWANEISVGPIPLTGVPVGEASPTDVVLGSSAYQGTLGLTALKQFDLILDGIHGDAYFSPKKNTSRYAHNRLGAVFVPADSRTNELSARVADGSPAQEAGIRDGDVLVKLDGAEVTKRDADGLRQFWQPAGTKLRLTLKRGTKILETTVTLQDILPPVNMKGGQR